MKLLYFIIITIRNKWFDFYPPPKLHIPIISVGNISTGGTGKTPFVIFLCNLLKNHNYNPCVVARGYKRKNKNDIIVSDGNDIFSDVYDSGDEMIMVANKIKTPVFVSNSKANFVKKINL